MLACLYAYRTHRITITNFCLGKHLVSEDDLLKDQRGSPAYISPDVLSGKWKTNMLHACKDNLYIKQGADSLNSAESLVFWHLAMMCVHHRVFVTFKNWQSNTHTQFLLCTGVKSFPTALDLPLSNVGSEIVLCCEFNYKWNQNHRKALIRRVTLVDTGPVGILGCFCRPLRNV